MNAIWKFQLDVLRVQNVPMPKSARLVHVAAQFEKPCVWAIVNPEEEMEGRQIGILTTGELYRESDCIYIGSFMLDGGSFVGHVVEPSLPGPKTP